MLCINLGFHVYKDVITHLTQFTKSNDSNDQRDDYH
jgi:hypothetical protein